MATKKYTLKFGKHYLGQAEDGLPRYAHVGDVVELSKSQYQNWSDKFDAVDVNAVTASKEPLTPATGGMADPKEKPPSEEDDEEDENPDDGDDADGNEVGR